MGLTQVSSDGVKDGSIKNVDVNSSAAIAGSKIAAATTSVAGTMSAADKTKLDAIASGATGTPEGTAIKSTGETGTAKYLRIDGDNTCSWQVPPDTNTTYSIQDGELSQNNFTNADHTKLDGIEASATADQTGAEIKSAYEGEADTNAYTDAEKTKLAGIAASAEVNVQSDWNASSGDAQILNKPTIPAAQVQSDWNATSGLGEVLNKPTIPSAQVSSDWNSTSSPTEILNKPTVPTVTGSTNNTITTVTGANAIQGEANLTYDGDVLSVGTGSGGAVLKVQGAEGGNAEIWLQADEGDDNADNWLIYHNQSNNKLKFASKPGGSYVDNVNFQQDGTLEIVDGDLKIGTSGHGIDFAAVSDGSRSVSSNILDDYESGTWTPTMIGWDTVTAYAGSNYHYGWYVKVGRIVHFGWKVYFQTLNTPSTDPTIKMTGLPFTSGGHVSGPTVHFAFHIPEFGVADNNYYSYMPSNNTIFYCQKNSGGTVTDVDATANRSNVWSMGSGTYMT